MKKILAVMFFALLSILPTSSFANGVARILAVHQVRQPSSSHQECRPAGRQINLLGAGLGALAGNQIGNGNGRTVATVAGALLGSQWGNQEEDCQTINSPAETYYQVFYRYKGQDFRTYTHHRPGHWLSVDTDGYPLD